MVSVGLLVFFRKSGISLTRTLSGDIGYYDDSEHIFIVDRIKDFIKYQSMQVQKEIFLVFRKKCECAPTTGLREGFPKLLVLSQRSELVSSVKTQNTLHFGHKTARTCK